VNDPGRRDAPNPLRTVAFAFVVTAVDAALMALALGGVPALLANPRALTLLALWATSSLLLGFLRPVHAQDVTETRADAGGVRALLLLIPLFVPPVSAFCEREGLGTFPGGSALRLSGIALAALGLLLRIAAMVQLGRRFSPRVAIQRDHELETRGLYARVRHPGYLGALLTNLGAALTFASGIGVFLVAALAFAVRARIAREEVLLEQRFGDDYRRYRERTGALLPRV
jgi:protein-S-isoprenylcysteine O-methyltransferase Ste14